MPSKRFYTLKFFQHLDLDLGYLNSVFVAVSIQISSVKATGLVYRIVKTNTAHVTLHF